MFIKRALTLMSLASLTFACTPQEATMPSLDKIPSVSVSDQENAGVVVVRLGSVLTTQATAFKTISDVASYTFELVADLGAPNYSTNNYSTQTNLASSAYVMLANDSDKIMKFTNVPAGTYRVRVKAFSDAGATTNISKAEALNGPTNSNFFAISTNTATVTNGSSVTYSASQTTLVANVKLLDNVGDDVKAKVSVTDGSNGTITGADGP